MTNEGQCQVCWSLIFDGEERCIVHHDEMGDVLSCIHCGAAAEKLGWFISCV